MKLIYFYLYGDMKRWH